MVPDWLLSAIAVGIFLIVIVPLVLSSWTNLPVPSNASDGAASPTNLNGYSALTL